MKDISKEKKELHTKLHREKIKTELNQRLRIIRLFCNHAKHSKKKQGIKAINMTTQSFPIPFPIKFDHFEVHYDEPEEGCISIPALPLIKEIFEFWDRKDNETSSN